MVESEVDTYGVVQAAPLFSESEAEDYTEVFAWGSRTRSPVRRPQGAAGH